MYSLSTAYDPTTATYDNIEWDWVADGGQTSTPTIGQFGDDGNRLFLTGGGYLTEWSSVSTLHPY
ncbi:MAG: hypothetical protein EBW46_10670, partial [Rhodobacterales bacterium]|nr:hypothetical protein [Rhodobacterales bacterium]